METGFGFPFVEGVEDDGAIDGAIGHVPHATDEGAVAFDEMRELLAGLGAGFVDGAEIAFEKDAAVFVALEDAAFVRNIDGVVAQKFAEFHAEVAGEMLGVAVGDGGGGDAAAVGAGGAIDGVFDLLGDGFEAALDEVVAFHPGAEAAIIVALFFTEPFDLDEVGYEGFGQETVLLSPGGGVRGVVDGGHACFSDRAANLE